MVNRGPFALFVLVKLNNKTIDDIINSTLGGYGPALWLVTDKYDDAPKKPHTSNTGTIPPIAKDFRSPWIGRHIDEIVEWLKAKPDETDLNDRHFAVLDAGVRDDPPTIVACRFGDRKREGKQLFLLRKEGMRAVEHLMGAPSDVWDELIRYGHGTEIRYERVLRSDVRG